MKITVLQQALLCLVSLVLASIPALGHAAENDATADLESQARAESLQSVSYITLRNVTGETAADDVFGDERDSIHMGQCVLSQASLSLLEPLSGNGLVYIPENIIELEAVSIIAAKTFWPDTRLAAGGQRPLLYLHGYNTSFAKSCEQASLFQANLKLENRLILFSWPSDGAILNYAQDESDLYWSIAPLEVILEGLVEQFGAGGFDVIAHSLGARGMYLALVQLAHKHHQQLPLINQLILTAPDIDTGIFKQYLPAIRPLVQNITLYVSDNDRPLALSREVHGYPRLGETGSHLKDLEDIEIVDISDVGVRSFSGHLYHLYHDHVVRDLDLLLTHGNHADQRDSLSAGSENHWRLRRP